MELRLTFVNKIHQSCSSVYYFCDNSLATHRVSYCNGEVFMRNAVLDYSQNSTRIALWYQGRNSELDSYMKQYLESLIPFWFRTVFGVVTLYILVKIETYITSILVSSSFNISSVYEALMSSIKNSIFNVIWLMSDASQIDHKWYIWSCIPFSQSMCPITAFKRYAKSDPGARFINVFFARNSNSIEASSCCNFVAGHQIATQICACHDSTAVVPCTNACSDHPIRIEVRVKISIEFELRWKNR